MFTYLNIFLIRVTCNMLPFLNLLLFHAKRRRRKGGALQTIGWDEVHLR